MTFRTPSDGLKAPVSVVIPCFRCADTIERAVESVTGQFLCPSEIILVDDCSEDGTGDILKRLASEKPELIKVILLGANGGPGSARNRGWEVARFPYLAFLDADDIWYPDKIRFQFSWMQANPQIVLTGHRSRIISTQDEMGVLQKGGSPEYSEVTRYQQLLANRFSTRTVMLKRDLSFRFEENKRYSEDFLLWSQILLSGNGCVVLDRVLAASFKAAYGEGGLSESLWKMQRGNLDSYLSLHRSGLVSKPWLFVFSFTSALRFLRRCVVRFRRSQANANSSGAGS